MCLGFSKEKIKINLLVAGIIVVVSIGVAFIFKDKPTMDIIKAILYYMFFIALQEEVIFRGMIQNYLFGLPINKIIIYVIGAVFFSLIHLPFQMFANDMVSFSYIIVALPQLAFTFLFHLLICFITYKRKDILIPTALHFAIDFIQSVF